MGYEQGDGSIIGTDAFDLTERDVVEVSGKVQRALEAWRQALDNPDKRIREDAQRSFSRAEAEAQAFQAAPREVLAQAQTFYDRAKELTAYGLDNSQVADKMLDEFPNITSFYRLLRKTNWGYRLGQKVAGAMELRENAQR